MAADEGISVLRPLNKDVGQHDDDHDGGMFSVTCLSNWEMAIYNFYFVTPRAKSVVGSQLCFFYGPRSILLRIGESFVSMKKFDLLHERILSDCESNLDLSDWLRASKLKIKWSEIGALLYWKNSRAAVLESFDWNRGSDGFKVGDQNNCIHCAVFTLE